MRKRVSLAAALINEPTILLMDEPFSALDVQTRAIMSNELLALWEQSEPSVMFVTHDLEEAIALADKVVVMTAGPGTVKAVYDIDLPRPRGAVQEIRFTPRFLELHHQIWETLRDEVERAYSRTARQRAGSRGMTAEAEAGPNAMSDHASHVRHGRTIDRGEGARLRVRRRKQLVLAGQIAAFVLVVGSWQLFSDLNIIDPFFFGSPLGIVLRLADWAVNGTAYGSLWLQIGVTLEESLLGFVFGVGSGIVFGVLLGEIRYLADVFGPYIKIVNALPRIVLGSIFTIWLGLGLPSKVLLAAVLVFFVVFFNAFQGVRSVDRNLVANARILGASRWQVVRHVVFPSAMTWIIASLHVALGFSIIGAIVGEFLGSQRGLGLVIATAQNTFDSNGVFGAMLVIGVLALSAEALMAIVEKRLLAWQPASTTERDIAGI